LNRLWTRLTNTTRLQGSKYKATYKNLDCSQTGLLSKWRANALTRNEGQWGKSRRGSSPRLLLFR
jgi:hypothetical protein